MLRHLAQSRFLSLKSYKVCDTVARVCLSTAATTESKPKWDLYAGVLVERMPIVSKELNQQEQEFQEFLWRIEFENSLKSDHELQHERDIKQAELIKKGKIEIDLDDASSKQTAQDLKDAYTEELKKFQPASRKTADDAKNNVTSTNRCLDDVLYLLVEQKLGNRSYFLLPQGPRVDGETMRQAAERVLREKCGKNLEAAFLSHAPCGYYKYKYPSQLQTESIGAKVFFYRATHQKGNVDTNVTKKFEWISRPTFDEKLKDTAAYAKSVRKFLL